jgi:hypothetical protein
MRTVPLCKASKIQGTQTATDCGKTLHRNVNFRQDTLGEAAGAQRRPELLEVIVQNYPEMKDAKDANEIAVKLKRIIYSNKRNYGTGMGYSNW